ncbi:putative anti-sigma regulatory factor, serine/threonine protein kinase [Actinobacteria bacterium OK006]|uniref:ATP-binding protein n=1 Tax=Streptomyces mirabilis TaxID=68239 RepID=UPI0006BABEEA|nr:putative anti-sigma regulatory factor, serine/threonine protein kinase [Actinobacteria bacterium OK006]
MEGSSLRAVGWARTLPLNSEVKTARDWAREHLEALGWTTAAPQTVDAVLLTVSELVTNAHRHAHSSAQLVMTCDDHCLHVSVHDRSGDLPVAREAGTESLGGRGMLLVDAMADTWESRPCPHGKSVSACFRAPDAKTHEVDAPTPSRHR